MATELSKSVRPFSQVTVAAINQLFDNESVLPNPANCCVAFATSAQMRYNCVQLGSILLVCTTGTMWPGDAGALHC